jgi:alkyl hydroperoxide reductase subunit AhpC
VKKHSIVRSVFVVDKQGILRFVLYGKQRQGRAPEILRAVEELNS